ncbi:MAG: UPF0280 family protein [Burkholderiaceae bacterium]
MTDACARAWSAFENLLPALVRHLHLLRRELPAQVAGAPPVVTGQAIADRVARRMILACWPFREHRLTPMAAVAGAVAEAILETMRGPGIDRVWVNNGGDIALHLGPGRRLRVALASAAASALPVVIEADDPVRGVATSGWRGRSFSLGIADAVTVLAADAASADAAATLIANAVDLDDPRIGRRPACELAPDSDLGERLVTVSVDALDGDACDRAIVAGARLAQSMADAGRIVAARIELQGRQRIIGHDRPRSMMLAALADAGRGPGDAGS